MFLITNQSFFLNINHIIIYLYYNSAVLEYRGLGYIAALLSQILQDILYMYI